MKEIPPKVQTSDLPVVAMSAVEVIDLKAAKYADDKLERTDKELSETSYSRHRKMSVRIFDGSDIEQAYDDGYRQAEKDLALTWEDMQTIWQLCDILKDEQPDLCSTKDFFSEVLRRFNKLKGKQK